MKSTWRGMNKFLCWVLISISLAVLQCSQNPVHVGLGWHTPVFLNTWGRKGETLQGIKLPLKQKASWPLPFQSLAWRKPRTDEDKAINIPLTNSSWRVPERKGSEIITQQYQAKILALVLIWSHLFFNSVIKRQARLSRPLGEVC